MKRAEIFAEFSRLCRPYRFTGAWEYIPVDAEVRQMRTCVNSLVAVLTKKFSREELIESGLILERRGGDLVLDPKIGRPGTPFIGYLRDVASNAIYNLVTPKGMLVGKDPSAVAVLQDSRTISRLRRLPESVPRMFLAADLNDVILLRSFGFAAAGLDNLSPWNESRIEQLAFYQIKRPISDWDLDGSQLEPPPLVKKPSESSTEGDTRTDGDPNAEQQANDDPHSERQKAIIRHANIVFVNWCPSRWSFEPPAKTRAVIDKLRRLQDEIRLDVSSVCIWTPSEEHRDRIKSAVDRREFNWTKDEILASGASDVLDLEELDQPSAQDEALEEALLPRVEDLSTANSQLMNALRTPNSFGLGDRRIKEAILDLQRVVHEKLIQPLMALADAEPDPIQRNQLVLVCTTLQMQYDNFMAAMGQPQRRGQQVGPPNKARADASDTFTKCKQLLAMLGDVRKFRNHSE